MDNFNPDAFVDRYRQLRRATVARSALEALAFVFLIASFAFWSVCFWQLLTPPTLLSLQSVNVAVLALVFSLAAPLLWSALVPTTPAGQLLQKTQWRTVGFTFIVAAAVYLSWIAWQLLEMWLASQPGVQETGLVRQVAVALVIAFILLPALSWTQLTPERWLEQIRQSHQVRKLEIMQSGELAILKSRMIWAETKALAGYAKLLPAEQVEVQQTIQGLLMGIGDTQRALARTVGLSSDLDSSLGIMDDRQITDTMRYVTQQIEAPARVVDEAARALPRGDGRDAHDANSAHEDSRPGSSISREPPRDERRHMTPYDDTWRRAAVETFGSTPWTVKRLAERLDIGETRAREMKDAWYAADIIQETQLGRWSFTERGRAL
jgi:hypothetical protein